MGATGYLGKSMNISTSKTKGFMKALSSALPLVAVFTILSFSAAQALSPSGFQSKDGNENSQGGQDWQNIAPAKWQINQPDPFNSSKDDQFISKANSDNPKPRIDSVDVPYGRSDLTALRVASETKDNQSFVYLAWNRINSVDSANMNFEFNLNQTLRPRDSVPMRSVGDLLITFDFSRGAPHVDLGLSRWGTGSCQSSSDKSGCWSQVVDLDNSGFANGSVSTDGLFGEAVVNLTAAGIYGLSSCSAFNSATLVSRASAAFNSIVSDFTSPAKISMSNCAKATINAVGDPGSSVGVRTFVLHYDLAPLGGAQGVEDVPTSPNQSCTIAMPAGSCEISGIKSGSYWVEEVIAQPEYEKQASQSLTAVGDSRTLLTFAASPIR